ncbi:TonB-dependent receptor [Photobacterium lutimaris]|uniref:TonB-dependent receptor n=2 Tax=Photobacterium lutimaris TaxID=388278 RepID=A0A2T3J1V2_9GAMM|nr:TonB-dependent receptor [Photobacterium lutimaris]
MLNRGKIVLPLLVGLCSAKGQANDLEQLMSMSLEELAMVDIHVTSAAKKPQSLRDIPAAVYVISNEQIRRSGVRSIAEALALAPGIQVTRISEFNWQVSLRGLNEVLFNKLLVMIDGRTVYSPLMSGTFWHTIDTLLEDIERIEVIRGAAGTMWGGNAANGVVNIITKDTQETLGHYGEMAGGDYGYRELNYRYGTRFNDNVTARAFVKGVNGNYYIDNDDTWRNLRGGIRADISQDNRKITLQVGGYQTKSEHLWLYADLSSAYSDGLYHHTDLNVYSEGAYFSANWQEQYNNSFYEFNLWADTHSSDEPSAAGKFHTLDLEVLAHQQLNPDHQITFGGGSRVIHRRTAPYPDNHYKHIELWGRYSHDPVGTDTIFNTYFQLESKLSETLTSTFGLKVEHFSLNNSTELQPQARLLYQPNNNQQLWLGAARAVVTPSFVSTKTDGYRLSSVCLTTDCQDNRPAIIYTAANDNLDTESVVTLDMGHRYFVSDKLTVDSTIFYSQYDNVLMENDSQWVCIYGQCMDGTQLPSEMFALVQTYSDNLKLENYGFETAINWSPLPSFTINTSYSYIQTSASCSGHANCQPDATTGSKLLNEHQPAHLLSLQTLWQITPAWQLDLWFKHKSAVSTNHSLPEAPSISTLDARIAWHEKPHWPRIELIADALGKNPYEDMPGKARIDQNVFLKASWGVE